MFDTQIAAIMKTLPFGASEWRVIFHGFAGQKFPMTANPAQALRTVVGYALQDGAGNAGGAGEDFFSNVCALDDAKALQVLDVNNMFWSQLYQFDVMQAREAA